MALGSISRSGTFFPSRFYNKRQSLTLGFHYRLSFLRKRESSIRLFTPNEDEEGDNDCGGPYHKPSSLCLRIYTAEAPSVLPNKRFTQFFSICKPLYSFPSAALLPTNLSRFPFSRYFRRLLPTMILLRPLLISLLCSLTASQSTPATTRPAKMMKKMRPSWVMKRTRRNKCPANEPTHGRRCFRHPRLRPCAYNFLNVPASLPDGTCEGSLDCTPTTHCSCRNRKWECEHHDVVVCEAPNRNELPDGSLASCGKDANPPTQAPTENIFNHEPCPPEPPIGVGCDRPSNDEFQCIYEYSNIPIYEEDRTCRGRMVCTPSHYCQCLSFGWVCTQNIIAACANGTTPPGAGATCTPPAAE